MRHSNYYKNLFALFISAFIILVFPQNAAAANATLEANPASLLKVTNESYEITVRASSSSQFITVSSNVSFSNMIIESVTLNPEISCFKYPSTTDLSFTSCAKFGANALVTSSDIFTIRARSANTGSANLTFTNTKISDHNEYFGINVINGSYSIIRSSSSNGGNNNPVQRNGQVAGLETESCTPTCENKSCGDDGCGGFCGSCLPGFACSMNYSCNATEDFDDIAFITSWNNLPNDDFIDIKLDASNVRLGTDGNSLTGFSFYGNTNPNAQVHLYIFSSPLAFATSADELGGWRVGVNEPISSGTHKVYAVKMENGVVTRNSEVITLQVNTKNKSVYLGENQQADQQASDSQVQGVASNTTNNTVVILAVALVVTLLSFVIALILLKRRKEEYEYEIVE